MIANDSFSVWSPCIPKQKKAEEKNHIHFIEQETRNMEHGT